MIPAKEIELHDLRGGGQVDWSKTDGLHPVPPNMPLVDNSYTRDASNIIPGDKEKK